MSKYNNIEEIHEAMRNGELDVEEYFALCNQCRMEEEAKKLPDVLDKCENTFTMEEYPKVKVVLEPDCCGFVMCKTYVKSTILTSGWKKVDYDFIHISRKGYWEKIRELVLSKIYEFCWMTD